MLGAALGALVCYLAYKKHFDEDADGATKLAVFSTGPGHPLLRLELHHGGHRHLRAGVRHPVRSARPRPQLGPLAVALLVVGIGASLGGPTGYAINPARDLGPRIAHALLPIRGKGSSDWSYSWVPVFGPLVGGVLAGLVARAYIV